MDRWLIVSKYYGYAIGGAERSLASWISEKKLENVWYLRLSNPYPFIADEMSTIERPINYNLRFRFKRFQFLEWHLNYKRWHSIVNDAVRHYGITHVYAYGIYGNVEVVKGDHVQVYYSIRDEVGLGYLKNYHRGLRKFLYLTYQFANFPSRLLWIRRLSRNFNDCEVFTNSQFMTDLLTSSNVLMPLKIIVERPVVRMASTKINPTQNYSVVSIGNSVYKGLDIIKGLARKYPDITFHVFDKSIKNEVKRCNIIFSPSKPITNILAGTRILLIPSQWNEAYGRILREALFYPDLVIVCSNQNGLREGLKNSDIDRIIWVKDYRNLNSWIKTLRECVE